MAGSQEFLVAFFVSGAKKARPNARNQERSACDERLPKSAISVAILIALDAVVRHRVSFF
ncbi:hypothetical protein L0337_05100 [candidate division KSB1 bacterium]|nr:hypothetical protein [candidate division KSB1 bacterium]